MVLHSANPTLHLVSCDPFQKSPSLLSLSTIRLLSPSLTQMECILAHSWITPTQPSSIVQLQMSAHINGTNQRSPFNQSGFIASSHHLKQTAHLVSLDAQAQVKRFSATYVATYQLPYMVHVYPLIRPETLGLLCVCVCVCMWAKLPHQAKLIMSMTWRPCVQWGNTFCSQRQVCFSLFRHTHVHTYIHNNIIHTPFIWACVWS